MQIKLIQYESISFMTDNNPIKMKNWIFNEYFDGKILLLLFVYQKALLETFYTSFFTKMNLYENSQHKNINKKRDFVLKNVYFKDFWCTKKSELKIYSVIFFIFYI